MPAKRYKVTLSSDERHFLNALVSKGQTVAYKITRARILLKADEGPEGPGWPDERIREALDVGHFVVEHARRAFVEGGLEAALGRKPQERPPHQKFDGAKEAHLITLACSDPPDGRESWTLQLLADRMVQLKHFKSISREAVRRTLKKTSSSRG